MLMQALKIEHSYIVVVRNIWYGYTVPSVIHGCAANHGVAPETNEINRDHYSTAVYQTCMFHSTNSATRSRWNCGEQDIKPGSHESVDAYKWT